MSNYEDFDLDLKKVRGRNTGIEPNATLGIICEGLTSIITNCRDTSLTCNACTANCPTPSIDYEHRSCRGPLNDGTIQINC